MMAASMDKPVQTKRPAKIESVPHLVRLEILACMICMVLVFLVAVVADAPLGGGADAEGSPAENVKAPWIFVGIQFMLRHMDALIAGIIIPVGAAILIIIIPYFRPSASGSRYLRAVAFLGICLASVALTLWGYYW